MQKLRLSQKSDAYITSAFKKKWAHREQTSRRETQHSSAESPILKPNAALLQNLSFSYREFAQGASRFTLSLIVHPTISRNQSGMARSSGTTLLRGRVINFCVISYLGHLGTLLRPMFQALRF